MKNPLILLLFAVATLGVASAAQAAERGGNGADIREARQLAAQSTPAATPATGYTVPDGASTSMRRPTGEK
ncbi:hypothetical protein [Aquitalea aquatilis]|uniref:hypothetical protein n=1 Tax=Aquitalea aquatilis TaxID=1537400 RepID=UPI0010BD61F8|nr:hypothetical protein [Aquitalea aquatilis]